MRLLGYCGRWISHEGPLQGSGTSIIPNSDPPSSLSSRTTLLVPVLVERFPYLQLPAGAEFLNYGILYPSVKAANKTRQDKTRYWIRNEYLHKTHKVSFTQAFLSKTLEGTSYLHTHEIKKTTAITIYEAKCWFSRGSLTSITRKTLDCLWLLHLIYFISNVYEQQFLRLVEILRKVINATSLCPFPKQRDLFH